MPVTFIGCPAPYREAVEGHLRVDDSETVLVILCDAPERWAELATGGADPDVTAIGVLASLDVDAYAQALSLGAAGVVYVDTPSAITADVICSALNREVVLPVQAAQALAALARRSTPNTDLDERDRALLRAIASGTTIVALAEQWHYSERTVRRHLQSLYLKLGVDNRAEAIAAAARMGLAE